VREVLVLCRAGQIRIMKIWMRESSSWYEADQDYEDMDEEDHIAGFPVGSWCFSSVSNHRAELFWLKGLHVRTRVRLRVVMERLGFDPGRHPFHTALRSASQNTGTRADTVLRARTLRLTRT